MTERVRKGRGQPSVAIRLVPEAAYSFGISIMTDSVSVVLLNFAGSVISEETIHRSPEVRRDAIKLIQETIDKMIDEHVGDTSKIFGVGVSISGYFVDDDTTVNPPSDLEDWALVDVRQLLVDYFNLPVWVGVSKFTVSFK